MTNFLLSQRSADGWWLSKPTVRMFLELRSPEHSRLVMESSSAQLPAMMKTLLCTVQYCRHWPRVVNDYHTRLQL